jgi:hypothetical protein
MALAGVEPLIGLELVTPLTNNEPHDSTCSLIEAPGMDLGAFGEA